MPNTEPLEHFSVIVLIPPADYGDGGLKMVGEILADFLREGDTYHYGPLTKDAAAKVTDATPLITYDPDQPWEFYWLHPPKYLMQ